MTVESLTPALLHGRLRMALPGLRKLLGECQQHLGEEDLVYRFYDQSFKVYRMQDLTIRISEGLQAVTPARKLHPYFLKILRVGTGKRFSMKMNQKWAAETRPIVEAFFHARYFLEMAVKYGKGRNPSLQGMPSGWAALLTLYRIR